MQFNAEPYTLKLSQNNPKTENDFRENLNFSWCNSALFNVVAIDNKTTKIEYDAILWNEMEKVILFIEYKDSPSAKKNMKAYRAQQIKAISRNIARAFGFRWYNFIIVVNSMESVFENGAKKIEFESTIEEIALADKLLKKYNRKEKPVEIADVLNDLEKLKKKIDEMNT